MDTIVLFIALFTSDSNNFIALEILKSCNGSVSKSLRFHVERAVFYLINALNCIHLAGFTFIDVP
jgi:hypothetical protein